MCTYPFPLKVLDKKCKKDTAIWMFDQSEILSINIYFPSANTEKVNVKKEKKYLELIFAHNIAILR